MGETVGILMAMLSSALGGTVTALIRFMIGSTDPVTLAALRFGSGFVILLPVALWLRSPWPKGRDWVGVVGLGILFFGLCFTLFNFALSFTTAARGALAMSTLPLLTMLAAAALKVERLTLRKSLGVFIAIAGTSAALVAGLAAAPPGALRGDLIMLAAALCMALYNVWSRPFIKRSAPPTYVTATMGAGSLCVAIIAWVHGGFAVLNDYGPPQWLVILYLGAIGCGPPHRGAPSPNPRRSRRLWPVHWIGLASRVPRRAARIFCATRWRPRCSEAAPRWRRSAPSCVTATSRPRPVTRRSTSTGCA